MLWSQLPPSPSSCPNHMTASQSQSAALWREKNSNGPIIPPVIQVRNHLPSSVNPGVCFPSWWRTGSPAHQPTGSLALCEWLCDDLCLPRPPPILPLPASSSSSSWLAANGNGLVLSPSPRQPSESPISPWKKWVLNRQGLNMIRPTACQSQPAPAAAPASAYTSTSTSADLRRKE